MPVKLETRVRRPSEVKPNQPSGCGLHHQSTLPLPKYVREVGFVVTVNYIVEPWLAAKFINALRDLITSSIAKTREQ